MFKKTCSKCQHKSVASSFSMFIKGECKCTQCHKEFELNLFIDGLRSMLFIPEAFIFFTFILGFILNTYMNFYLAVTLTLVIVLSFFLGLTIISPIKEKEKHNHSFAFGYFFASIIFIIVVKSYNPF